MSKRAERELLLLEVVADLFHGIPVVDRKHDQSAFPVLLEKFLQVGKLPTAGSSVVEPEVQKDDFPLEIGKLHGTALEVGAFESGRIASDR